jgi:hypothetical protein
MMRLMGIVFAGNNGVGTLTASRADGLSAAALERMDVDAFKTTTRRAVMTKRERLEILDMAAFLPRGNIREMEWTDIVRENQKRTFSSFDVSLYR